MKSNYARGVEKEHAFVRLMLSRDCVYAYRTAGSHSMFDVIAVGEDSQVYLTQIKRTKIRNKAHYLNAPACLQLQQFADNIDYCNNPHMTLTWAVWVDYRGWTEYTLYWVGEFPLPNARGRLAANHIKRAYRAHQEGWVWVDQHSRVWKVVEGVVIGDNNAWKVLPKRRIQDPR